MGRGEQQVAYARFGAELRGVTAMVYAYLGAGPQLIDPTVASVLSAAPLNSLNQAAGTIPANIITGGDFVTVLQTNATPGTQTTRTAVQMFAEDATAFVNQRYTLRICNSGAGTLTLAGGTGVTVTGTATVATTTFRDFNCTYGGTPTAPTLTITNIGTGTYT